MKLVSPGKVYADIRVVGQGDRFRHAGFSASEVKRIHPDELYCGRNTNKLD